MRQTAIIFDIDGTIADCSHRLRFIRNDAPDWNRFFDPEQLRQDKPIRPMIEVIAAFDTLHSIVFCTGRPKKVRSATIDWIEAHMPWLTAYSLLMRADSDRRPSAEIKADHLEKLRAHGFDPILAFEDRANDTAMWRTNGLVCCQVAEGAY